MARKHLSAHDEEDQRRMAPAVWVLVLAILFNVIAAGLWLRWLYHNEPLLFYVVLKFFGLCLCLTAVVFGLSKTAR